MKLQGTCRVVSPAGTSFSVSLGGSEGVVSLSAAEGAPLLVCADVGLSDDAAGPLLGAEGSLSGSSSCIVFLALHRYPDSAVNSFR